MRSGFSWGVVIVFSSAVLGSVSFTGCSSSSSGGGVAGDGGTVTKTPGQELCESIASYVNSCGPATPCDQALVTDCAKVVDLLSADFLTKTKDCMKAGGAPSSCLSGSLSGLTPTAAQKQFATTFCGECAGGLVPGCEQVFFAEGDSVPEQLKIAGKVILPFSDGLVTALETECATANPLTCVANFSSCAQGVLAKQALPTETGKCILDSLVSGGGSSAPSTCADSGSGGSGGTAGTGAGGSGGGSGGVGGGSGGVGGGSGGSGGVGGGGGSCGTQLVGQSCGAVGFADPNCDNCAQSLCCSAIETCLANTDCAGLVECISTFCNTASDPSQCAQDNCSSCATQTSVDLYNGIGTCLQGSCAGVCG